MDDSSSTENVNSQEQRGEWALPVSRLNVDSVPDDAVNLNVAGRHVSNVMQGFGQMWQKTYRIRFDGVKVSPREVIRVWKEDFSSFWPEGNYFYKGKTGPLKAGDVAVLNLAGPGGVNAPGGKPMISTGILVIYADDESFSFLTPEGHMFSGMNTFSSYEENGVTYAQIQALVRASDPLYEVMLRLGIGHKMEDDFWSETLKNLAKRFGAAGVPTLNRVNVDSRVQWSEATNIWHNAGIRTTMYTVATPFRWVGRKLRGK
jgi:hypothetical protein